MEVTSRNEQEIIELIIRYFVLIFFFIFILVIFVIFVFIAPKFNQFVTMMIKPTLNI